jgi:hypothetical protein
MVLALAWLGSVQTPGHGAQRASQRFHKRAFLSNRVTYLGVSIGAAMAVFDASEIGAGRSAARCSDPLPCHARIGGHMFQKAPLQLKIVFAGLLSLSVPSQQLSRAGPVRQWKTTWFQRRCLRSGTPLLQTPVLLSTCTVRRHMSGLQRRTLASSCQNTPIATCQF